MKSRSGFTLVELIVVLAILGILAAIAGPKILTAAGSAADKTARANLTELRNAIDAYAGEHGGTFPGKDMHSFKAAVQPYLRGPFPSCPVGTGAADGVTVVSGRAAGGKRRRRPGQRLEIRLHHRRDHHRL